MRLCAPFHGSWAVIAMDMLVGGDGPQTSWLHGLPVTAADALVGMTGPQPRGLRGLTVTVASMLASQSRNHLGGLPVLAGAACWMWWSGSHFGGSSLGEQVEQGWSSGEFQVRVHGVR